MNSFSLNFSREKFLSKYDLSETKKICPVKEFDSTKLELYTVKNKQTQEICAAKEYCSDKIHFIDRIWKELDAILKIRDHKNPHIIKYHEAYLYDTYNEKYKEENQVLIIIMELGDYPLSNFIPNGLSEHQSFQKLKQTLIGLEFLKRNNIYHRDIKPSNLILKNDQIKIIDLDVSKISVNDQSKQFVTGSAGTPIYMDPHQKQLEEQSPKDSLGFYLNIEKSDLYSLGLTFLQITRKMGQISYKSFINRLNTYFFQKHYQKYEFALKEELNHLENDKLRKILQNILTLDLKERWTLQQCLIYACKLSISIESPQDILQFQQNWGTKRPQKITLFRSLEIQIYNTQFPQIEAIFDTIKTNFDRIQDLSFYSNQKLSHEETQKLTQFLHQIPSLTSLDLFLQQSQLDPQSTETLSQQISKITTLNSLKLDFNSTKIPVHFALKFPQNFASLVYLNLDLAQNQICPQGIQKLMKSLRNLYSLMSLTLYLWKNELGLEGGKILGESLQYFPKMTQFHLDIWGNNIGPEGIKEIGNGLKYMNNLQYLELDLFQNGIGLQQMKGLFNNIRKLYSIQSLYLNIGDNEINDPKEKENLKENVVQLQKTGFFAYFSCEF